ncbi:MAG: UPF0179 family protein [Crenarchaeota archaeon]|nr:UPF0179 family protein [Thermoproteota archaeon]
MFTYIGEAYECTKCSNRRLCHSTLITGLSYRVVKMTGGESIYCMIRGEEVFPYEVSLEPLVLLATKGKAKEGAVMELKLDDAFCKMNCERLGECPILFNMLLVNRRARVLERLGDFDCPEKNLSLIRVEILD